MTMNKLTELEVEELLILYDELYRYGSMPLWHEQRKDPKSSEFKIFEECYDKFKTARKIALAESGKAHYERKLNEIQQELDKK